MSFRNLQIEIESRLTVDTTVSMGPRGPLPTTVLPANFSGSIPTDEWARLNIFAPGSAQIGYGNDSTNSGFIEFNIFVDEGQGVSRAHEIADDLMARYVGQEGHTIFQQGTIATKAVDSVNPNLFRVDLRIPFTRYN